MFCLCWVWLWINNFQINWDAYFPSGGDDLAYYGTKLRYAAIRVNLTLSKNELEFSTGLPIMDDWEEFLDAEVWTSESVQLIPETLGSSFWWQGYAIGGEPIFSSRSNTYLFAPFIRTQTYTYIWRGTN